MMVTIMIICTALRCQVASQQVNERKKFKVAVPQGTDCLDNLTTDRVPLPERSGQSSLSWSRHVAFCISDAAGAVRAGPGDAAQDSRSSSSRAAGSPGPPAPVLRRLPRAIVFIAHHASVQDKVVAHAVKTVVQAVKMVVRSVPCLSANMSALDCNCASPTVRSVPCHPGEVPTATTYLPGISRRLASIEALGKTSIEDLLIIVLRCHARTCR